MLKIEFLNDFWDIFVFKKLFGYMQIYFLLSFFFFNFRTDLF